MIYEIKTASVLKSKSLSHLFNLGDSYDFIN